MAKVDFETIRQKVREGDYEISVHASKRLRQRQLKLADVENVILTGEIVERSSRAKPFPKYLSRLDSAQRRVVACSVFADTGDLDRNCLLPRRGPMGTRSIPKKVEKKKKKVAAQRDERAACPICGSPTIHKTIHYIDWNDGHVLVVSDVPVRECRGYGHQFLRAATAKKIERLFELDRQRTLQPKEMIVTPVVELSMAA